MSAVRTSQPSHQGIASSRSDLAGALAEQSTGDGTSEVSDDLSGWLAIGMTEAEAVQWWGLNTFDPAEAASWWARGYQPKQAEFVTVLVTYTALEQGGEQDVASPAQWRDCALPPHLVCLYVAAGTVDSERTAFECKQADLQQYRALTTRALERGVDPWRLDWALDRRSYSPADRVTTRSALRQVFADLAVVAFSCARHIRPPRSRARAARAVHSAASSRARAFPRGPEQSS